MPEPTLLGGPDWVQRAEQILARVGAPATPSTDDVPDDPDIPGTPSWHRDRIAEHEHANISPKFADATTDLPIIGEWVQQYLANPRGAYSLLLTGRLGTGKTHAAWAALRMIGRTGGRFVPWRATSTLEWFPMMRPPSTDPEAAFQRYAKAPVLLLDDLGADKPSEWAEAVTLRLIDLCYEEERPLIITTNCGPDLLERQVGARVRSRLAEMTGPNQHFHYEVKGPDRRREATS